MDRPATVKGVVPLLYLFNSASREVYFKNILNTMYLPAGCSNQHRWQPENIEPAVARSLERLAAGTECVLHYAHLREGEPPLYVPLRKVSLARTPETINGKIYFHVLEGDYVCSTDLGAYQRELSRVLQGHLPPTRPMDANQYVIQAEAVGADSLIEGPEAWLTTVKTLEGLLVPKEGEGTVVFCQAALTRKGAPIAAKGTGDSNPGWFEVSAGQPCQLRLTYRTAATAAIGRETEVTVEAILGDVKWSAGTIIPIDGSEDSRWIEFAIPTVGPRSFRLMASQGRLIMPSATIDLVAVRSPWYWPRVAAWFASYIAVIALGRAAGSPQWLQTVAVCVQPGFVLWAVQLFGKSPL